MLEGIQHYYITCKEPYHAPGKYNKLDKIYKHLWFNFSRAAKNGEFGMISEMRRQ